MRYPIRQMPRFIWLAEKGIKSSTLALAAPFNAAITHAQVLDTLVWLDALA